MGIKVITLNKERMEAIRALALSNLEIAKSLAVPVQLHVTDCEFELTGDAPAISVVADSEEEEEL